MKMIRNSAVRLWREETGATSPAALLLLVTIVVLGAIVGLATLRDQIVQEFGDVGIALESLDQSYSVVIEVNGNIVYEAEFDDTPNPDAVDNPGAAPFCLTIGP